MHPIRNRALLATALAASLLLAACGKKETTDAAPGADGPSLSDALSSKGQENAAARALPKADVTTPLTVYRKIESGNDLMFLYYALSSIPPEMDKIAERYSSEYRQSSDAFRKKDILKAIEPRIVEEISKAKTQRYFTYEIDQGLTHYDFDKKEFRLSNGLSANSTWYFNDNSSYQVQFGNADAFQALSVTDEALARDIEKAVGSYHRFTLLVYAYAQDVDFNDTHIKAQVVKVKLLDRQGKELLTQ